MRTAHTEQEITTAVRTLMEVGAIQIADGDAKDGIRGSWKFSVELARPTGSNHVKEPTVCFLDPDDEVVSAFALTQEQYHNLNKHLDLTGIKTGYAVEFEKARKAIAA